MRRDVLLAALGFLVGAAALAGGQEDPELRERLIELQDAAARAMRAERAPVDLPPHDGQGNELAFLPVGDLTAPIPQYAPAVHELRASKDVPLFGGVYEDAPEPFGTIEELMELVRASVLPEAWETGMISAQRTRLVLLNRPRVNREVARFLDETLRPRAHRCVTIEAEVVEGDRPRFAARATALAGQRFVVWHGRQVAVLSDADVEVATEASTADPNVEVVQAGGSLSVRASAGDDPERLVLDVVFEHQSLREIRRAETQQGGVLDQPVTETRSCVTSLSVRTGVWTDIGDGLRIRAALLPRGVR